MPASDMKLPTGVEREYIRLFGAAAVYVATYIAGRPCIVGVSQDLEKTARHLRSTSPIQIDITAAYWMATRAQAEALVCAVRSRNADRIRDDGMIAITAELARFTLERVAAEMNLRITCHDIAMARVSASVAHIAEHIEEARVTGKLQAFNRLYAAYREQAVSKGARCMNYTEALARLRQALVRQHIENIPPNCPEELYSEVFKGGC